MCNNIKIIMWNSLKTIKLALQLAISDFKLKNEGSYIGVFWYILNPALLFVLLFFVFKESLGVNIENYSIYLLFGIIIFNFFQAVTLESTKTIVHENHFLIKSIDFPRESLVMAIVIKNIFSHLIEIVLFGILITFWGINFFNIFYYVIILILFSLFCYGLSLLLSSMTVYFIDLDNIWNFVTKLLIFGTPIFYSIKDSLLALKINLINPLYYFIETSRSLVIYNSIPEINLIIGTLLFAIITPIIGIFVFKKLNKKIAELI